MYSQSDIDYKARSASYQLCKCVNDMYSLDEDVIELLSKWYELDEYQFSKIMTLTPKHIRESVMKAISTIDKIKFGGCIEILDEYYSDDINVVDSDDNRELYEKSIMRYLSYNYDCKLSEILIKNKL